MAVECKVSEVTRDVIEFFDSSAGGINTNDMRDQVNNNPICGICGSTVKAFDLGPKNGINHYDIQVIVGKCMENREGLNINIKR